jgi:LysM repeat protein
VLKKLLLTGSYLGVILIGIALFNPQVEINPEPIEISPTTTTITTTTTTHPEVKVEATEIESEPIHVVVTGETLVKISTITLDTPNRWLEISVHNELENPHIIIPGQVLKIPIEPVDVTGVEVPALPQKVQQTPSPTTTTTESSLKISASAPATKSPAPASKGSGAAPSSDLQSIAKCESGGDPTAVSPSGKYRGKYQFDRQTYNGLGYEGDPAAAPESTQDQAAADLYTERGSQPWPTCG